MADIATPYQIPEGTPYSGLVNPYWSAVDQQALSEYFAGKQAKWIGRGAARSIAYDTYLQAVEWDTQMQKNIAEWQSQADIFSQQTEGQRQAGLNPALNGVSGDAPSPVSPSQIPSFTNDVQEPISATLGIIGTIGDTVMKSISQIQQLQYQDKQIKGLDLVNRGFSLDNTFQAMRNADQQLEFMQNYVLNNFSESEIKSYLEPDGLQSFAFDSSVLSSRYGFDEGEAQRMAGSMNQAMSSASFRAKFTELLKTRVENQDAYQQTISKPQYKDSFDPSEFYQLEFNLLYEADTWQSKYRKTINKYLNTVYNLQNPQLQAASANALNGYNAELYENLDPVSLADFQNAENEFGAAVAEFKDWIRGECQKVIQDPNSYTPAQHAFVKELYRNFIQSSYASPLQWATQWFGTNVIQRGMMLMGF